MEEAGDFGVTSGPAEKGSPVHGIGQWGVLEEFCGERGRGGQSKAGRGFLIREWLVEVGKRPAAFDVRLG